MKRFLRKVLRALAWPIRRILNPRFAALDLRLDQIEKTFVAETEATLETVNTFASASRESATYIGRELTVIRELMQQLEHSVFEERLAALYTGRLSDVQGAVADLLNYSVGPEGFAAQANLWFNPPLWILYKNGSAAIHSVNERIAELPYAFKALSHLEPGASVLDVGSSESTFPLSLASLGHKVTAVDFRPLPYSHPNLTFVQSALSDFESEDGQFDVAFSISSIEHFGLSSYGNLTMNMNADKDAVAQIWRMLKPDGVFVLTVPFGEPRVTEFERIYDDEALSDLLEGWSLRERVLLEHSDSKTWLPASEVNKKGVALVTAAPLGK